MKKGEALSFSLTFLLQPGFLDEHADEYSLACLLISWIKSVSLDCICGMIPAAFLECLYVMTEPELGLHHAELLAVAADEVLVIEEG